MNTRLRKLREDRGAIIDQMKTYANKAQLTDEDRLKLTELRTSQEQMKDEITRIEEVEALDAEVRGGVRRENPPTTDPAELKDRKEKYERAFGNYLKYGWNARPDKQIVGISEEDRSLLAPTRKMIDLEARDLGTGAQGAYPGATAGFFVPVGFVNKIEEALKFFGGMREAATDMATATGQVLPFPTDNDTTNEGELLAEGVQTNSQDVALSQILFGAYKFSSKLVKVSIELLQDSAFDLDAYLVRKFSTRIGRVTNRYFTTGTGSGEPKGIVVASTNSGITVIGDDNATTPNPVIEIGYLDLVNLEHSVDPDYRKGAKFMLHDTTLAFIKKLKDKFGHPLWMPGMANGNAPATINGYQYIINNDMAPITQTSPISARKTVLFGDLSKYTIRRVLEMRVLRLEERFADYGQVAFLAFWRGDGNLLDAGTHPVKYLSNPAS